MTKRMIGVVVGVCIAPLVLAQGKDLLWEITSTMEMPGMAAEMKGMKIPGFGEPTKQTVCLKEGEKHEDEHQKDCKITDSSQSGRVYRATLVCKDGTMKMEHEQISKDHWRAKMDVVGKHKDENMRMTTEGKRIGNCDAGKEGGMSRESQKHMADASAQAKDNAAHMARECGRAVSEWPAGAQSLAAYDQHMQTRERSQGRSKSKAFDDMFPDVPACAGAKSEYCAKTRSAASEIGTRKGYAGVMKRSKSPQSVGEAFRYCGAGELAPITSGHCRSAASESDYGFISAYCPEERKALARQHCAGRAYTAIEPKFRALCGYSGNLADDGGSASRSGETVLDGARAGRDKGVEAAEQGIRKLKGMFGF
jgi:hypothetical protein